MKSYDNKNIYITGGSSGIGLSTAKLLSSLGANIIIFARNRKKLEQSIREIEKSKRNENQKFSSMQLDIAKNDEVKKTMDKAVKEFGKPDILINSAGATYPSYFENISYKKFDEVITINLYGTRNVIASLLPYMKDKGGSIVNVSSIAGFIGVFGFTAYCASKFAIIGFSESLKSEFKRYGITVSVLCPPDTDTPMLQEENKIKPPETSAISSNAKIMHPDDVAKSLVKGIDRRAFMIIPGIEGKFIFIAKRLLPSLVDYIMDREIRKVQKSR